MIDLNLKTTDFRFEVISDLCSHNPKKYIKNRHAMNALQLSKSQLLRLKKRFDGTPNSLQHRNIGKTRKAKFDNVTLDGIVQNVRDWNNTLREFGEGSLLYTHAHSRILDIFGVEMSYTYFRKMMINNGQLSSRSAPRETPDTTMHLASCRTYKAGEEWQADGTFNFKLKGDETSYCAHVIVDRATSVIISVWLDYQETTNGYLNAFKLGFEKYGYPLLITTDKRTSFMNSTRSKDTLSCLGRIFKELEIDTRLTSNPRSKNQVESKNAIVKNHVMKELVLDNVTTLEEANAALPKVIEKINRYLSNQMGEDTLHKAMPKDYDYKMAFSRFDVRKLDKQNCLSWQGNKYFLTDCVGKVYKPRGDKRVNVHICYDGSLFVSAGNKKFELVEAYRENLRTYETSEMASATRSIRLDHYTVTWKKKVYHFTDTSGVAVKFDIQEKVKIYYLYSNGKYTPQIADVAGTKYNVKLGRPQVTEDTYESKLMFTQDSTVRLNNAVYGLYSINNNEVTLEKDTTIIVEIKNGTPTSGILNNCKYNLLNISSC